MPHHGLRGQPGYAPQQESRWPARVPSAMLAARSAQFLAATGVPLHRNPQLLGQYRSPHLQGRSEMQSPGW
ncbi:hypothetical protein NDU88_002951 [Pleurodeles waltl]|uniref:Uncharacterized protein n=1 Tax=Pleurodeles waltl TaxID=8319 RepID=A0AAV7MP55_PLEWA|nr:hypothetical protein NDU88_002951 [Pleurodeles waltl]